MFNLTYTSKQKDALKTIPVNDYPKNLGRFKDANGIHYDCKGYGNLEGDRWWAWLCPMSNVHPYYYDTSGMSYGRVYQKWETYYLEKINEQ